MDLFTAFGLSASAGLNAYIPLLVVAILARLNVFKVSEPWDALASWWTIGVLLALALIEFFADKIPAVNHANDLIQTLVRPTAGAILFAASTNAGSDLQPVVAGLLGFLG